MMPKPQHEYNFEQHSILILDRFDCMGIYNAAIFQTPTLDQKHTCRRLYITPRSEPLTGPDLGHVVMLAQLGQIRIELLDPLLVRLEQLGPRGG